MAETEDKRDIYESFIQYLNTDPHSYELFGILLLIQDVLIKNNKIKLRDIWHLYSEENIREVYMKPLIEANVESVIITKTKILFLVQINETEKYIYDDFYIDIDYRLCVCNIKTKKRFDVDIRRYSPITFTHKDYNVIIPINVFINLRLIVSIDIQTVIPRVFHRSIYRNNK